MTPAIPCFAGNATIVAGSTFSTKKEIQLTKYRVSAKCLQTILTPRGIQLPRSLSPSLFQRYTSGYVLKHGSRIHILAAVGADVTTEEINPAVSGEDADISSEAPLASSGASSGTNEASLAASSPVSPSAQSKRTRPVRKSDMPPVKNEELIPGASFTGKVRSIQPFGAFVDFGAFSDGLVHVSRLSDEFVKDVSSVVSVGQKVNIRLVEANMETGRISLTMRDSDDINKLLQQKEAPSSDSSDKPRTVRKNAARTNQKRDTVQKSTKLVKGQALSGTVKNTTRSGAFVSLPEGEEGFLPMSEESEGFGNILGSSSLQVGQEVDVRVLRIARGQVTLTMKKEEDVEGLNKKLNQGVVHAATNPFELAFRKNKDIAAFLEEREKVQKSADSSDFQKAPYLIDEKVTETVDSDSVEVEESSVSSTKEVVSIPSSDDDETPTVDHFAENTNTSRSKETVSSSASIVNQVSIIDEVEESEASTINAEEDDGSTVNFAVDEASKIVEGEKDGSADKITREYELPSEKLDLDGNGSSVSLEMENIPVLELRGTDTSIETVEENEAASIPESSAIDETSVIVEAKEELSASATVQKSERNSQTFISERNGSALDEVGGVKETSSETDPTGQSIVVPEGVIKSHFEDKLESETPLLVENELASSFSEDVKVAVVSDVNQAAPSDTENNGNAISNGQNSVTTQENSTKATISPSLVKQLRGETGAGMMDCKKALAETGGDIIKAQEFLRKKGLASADKKASRATAEGGIGSYIHDNRIGVLIEVNCETDFVSRGEIFRQLVDDLAMQVAACPQVSYLVTEDVPEEVVKKEREIELQKEDLLTKPEQIRSKIVDGRIRKRLEEFALLEQPYIKNDKIVVKDWVKQTIATIGENIKVRRFVRYNLGEGLEKKSQDFAAEVAAQAAAKPSAVLPKDQSTAAKEPIDKPPNVTVSAALVKQLREESGAGMMDCKKALIESEGNLEKAQEYLRKKGLSSADKKSSRLAAEGRISSYIHDSRIGVLIEVNCETDFAGRNERFRELVDDLAMQVAACPQVEFVSVEEIPESIVSKEREIEMQRDDLKSKPDNIKEKIVEGRISKRLGELALLEQPFIKDDSLLVKDLVKQTVAALGENIRVRRFERFSLGDNKDQLQ